MRGLFGSRKTPPPPEPAPEEAPAHPSLKSMLNEKEYQLYPKAVKLLWHFYNPADRGREEGTPKEFPGPIDEDIADSVKELEKENLVEVVSAFGEFGITAKLTKLGLFLMADQKEPGHLSPVRIQGEEESQVIVYTEVNLGF